MPSRKISRLERFGRLTKPLSKRDFRFLLPGLRGGGDIIRCVKDISRGSLLEVFICNCCFIFFLWDQHKSKRTKCAPLKNEPLQGLSLEIKSKQYQGVRAIVKGALYYPSSLFYWSIDPLELLLLCFKGKINTQKKNQTYSVTKAAYRVAWQASLLGLWRWRKNCSGWVCKAPEAGKSMWESL